MKPKIVCCMIVKNEEDMLARCLDSIKGVDNIYIADTGSTDKTVEIAKRYTANVFTDYTWNDNFAEARNHVLSKVKEEDAWILSIDADEYLHSFEEVRKAVDTAIEKKFRVVNVKLIGESTPLVHWFPRLFKKDPEVFWAGVAHNHISVLPEMESGVAITYGYSPAHQKDKDRTIRILEKEVYKDLAKKEMNPECSPRNMFYLGREYWYRKRYKDTVEILEKYINLAHFMAEKADAYLVLAKCYWAMGMWEQARQNCMCAILINANNRDALNTMTTLAGKGSGNILWEKNAQQWERMASTADNEGVLFAL